jgi:hypothetical protein
LDVDNENAESDEFDEFDENNVVFELDIDDEFENWDLAEKQVNAHATELWI